MANDVVSRIVLQAQGGDQAAREIGKTTKAFKEAGQAAQGVRGSGPNGGTTFDAFQKAVFGGQTPGVGQAQGFNQGYNSQTNQRIGDHFRRFGGEGGAGGGIARLRPQVSGVTGGANSIISGNAVGGGGQIMQSLAGAGTIGLIVAAVAGAAIGAKALADKDFDRQKQVGHGLMQSLGMGTNWESMNEQLSAARRAGVSAENIMAYMGASAAAGGTTSVEAIEMANRATLVSGASANTIATLQASRQKAGLGVSEGQLDLDIMRAGSFGPAGINKFLGAVSTSIEGAMSRGMAKGSIGGQGAYEAGTRMLSALALQGGMSQEGAMQTFNQLNSSVAGFANMGTPQAAFQFMAQRKAGETYGQTVRRISTFGGQMEAYKNLKSQAGGDKGLLEIMVQQTFGLDWQAVPGTIEALENQIMDPSMRGQYVGGEFTPDNVLIESVQSRQMDILKDAGEGANKAWNWATRGWRNRATRKEQEAEYNALLGGGYGSGTSIGAMKATGEMGALPPEISQFADLAKSNAMDTFLGNDNVIMSELLPQLAGYEQFRTNRGSMTAEEQAMYETFAPLFDSLIATLSDPTIARGASAGTWMDDYDRRVTSLDASKDVDNLLGTITIVELLEMINEKLGLASIMDSDATESGQ